MGMPCFLDGKKLNSKPKIDKDPYCLRFSNVIEALTLKG